MERTFYDAASLVRTLEVLELRYGRTSDAVYAASLAGDHLEDLPRFHRHLWVATYRELRRLRGDDFTENAERLLALV